MKKELTYKEAVDILADIEGKHTESQIMDAIDKIVASKTLALVSKQELFNALRWIRKHTYIKVKSEHPDGGEV